MSIVVIAVVVVVIAVIVAAVFGLVAILSKDGDA